MWSKHVLEFWQLHHNSTSRVQEGTKGGSHLLDVKPVHSAYISLDTLWSPSRGPFSCEMLASVSHQFS